MALWIPDELKLILVSFYNAVPPRNIRITISQNQRNIDWNYDNFPDGFTIFCYPLNGLVESVFINTSASDRTHSPAELKADTGYNINVAAYSGDTYTLARSEWKYMPRESIVCSFDKELNYMSA